MKTPKLHMPGAHPPHDPDHPHPPVINRLQKAEGAYDWLIIALVVILGAVMLAGILFSGGGAPWQD